MMILDILADLGELRFTCLSELVEGISRKMLTQTLRQMERDGLVVHTVHPVVPPKVEYRLIALVLSFGSAFRGVWVWAAENLEQVEEGQASDRKAGTRGPAPQKHATRASANCPNCPIGFCRGPDGDIWMGAFLVGMFYLPVLAVVILFALVAKLARSNAK